MQKNITSQHSDRGDGACKICGIGIRYGATVRCVAPSDPPLSEAEREAADDAARRELLKLAEDLQREQTEDLCGFPRRFLK